MPARPRNPDADSPENTLPEDTASNTECKGNAIEVANEERMYSSKVCEQR
jgi:hypothetical protein